MDVYMLLREMSLETTEKAKYKMGPKKSMTGKVKAWLMEMEEEAAEMTRDEFIDKHGEYQLDAWDCVNEVDAESYVRMKRGMDLFTVRGL